MYRIGILGSENSHAMAFSRIFNGLEPEEKGKYPDMKVVAIGGHEAEPSQKVMEECGLEFIADRPEDMLGRVDAVMVTARNGAFHSEFALPFIEAGLPLFIDKPIANDGEDALRLLQRAKEKGVPVVGGSSTKYVPDVLALKKAVESGELGRVVSGSISAPVNLDNPYGGFYFYASHLVEISMTVFGYNPKSVFALLGEGGITTLTHYDAYDISGHYIAKTGLYSGAVYGTSGNYQSPIDISCCYALEAEHFAHMLRTGSANQPLYELLQPVYVMNALEKSFTTGTPQPVKRAEI
jgi:predicted dehydrogenase